ncbi:hypothetical protein CUMW_184840 [Citrus unshiu]|uniref:Plant methyltransferase dimerisation domain-containing protein n=1 Tax=Citrus unshiu TaxID=55188 RepID=A0A2H5Q0Q2_CITUN|nr:hypothetical protein CUMW_184840 [Citrus unshiu]
MAVSSIFIASELYWGFRIPLHNSDLIIPLNSFRHFEHATISLNFFTHAAFAIILDKIGSKAHYALTLFLEAIAFGQELLLAMELASGAVLPMTMKSATELGLLEIMAKVSPTQLSYSFLTCNLVSNKDGSVQRLYGLTPVSKYFVPNKDGVSLAPTLLIIQDKISMDLGPARRMLYWKGRYHL